ncbi:MAG: FAD-dependent oxidoreductase [Pseudomonadota bacterium]
MDKVETTIIGAGVVGTAVAWELSKTGREIFVIEKNPGITQGENQSSRNAGVIHSGVFYDPATRPLKARLCPLGVKKMYDFCRKYDVPHLPCGKLLVATAEEDRPTLEFYFKQAVANGVVARMLDSGEVTAREPNVRAVCAIDLPSSGVVEPTRLVYKLYTLASNNGAQFLTHAELIDVRERPEGFELTVRRRDGNRDTFLSREVVNCAGLHADEVARMLDPDSPYRIQPMRGEFARYYRTKRPDLACATNVYPAPVKVQLPQGIHWAVGTHVTPTIDIEQAPDGSWTASPVNIVGPLSAPGRSKEDFDGEFQPMADYHEAVSPYFPSIMEGDLEPQHAGVLAILSGTQDWFMTRVEKHPGFYNLLGMDSPALTSSLAIADYVLKMMEARR